MEPPAEFTLKTALERSLRKYHSRIALHFEGMELTYRELDHQSNQIAAHLVDAGVDPSDRVALAVTNSVEYTIARLGIIKAGGAIVPIHVDLTEEEIQYMLSDSRSETLICGPGAIDAVTSINDSLDSLVHQIAVNEPDSSCPDGFESFHEIVDSGTASGPPDVTVNRQDIVGHHFTGGTTGKPKGVLFTQEDRLNHILAHFLELDINSDDTLLVTTPVAHAARLYLKSAWLTGAKVILHRDFDLRRTIDAMETQGVTWTFMVPTMIYRILDQIDDQEVDFSTLETLVYGAAPIRPDRLQEALDTFGPVLIQLYGQTEVPSLVTTLGKQEHLLGQSEEFRDILQSAGQPCVMADVKIVDVDTGVELSPGEVGEIVATAEYMMKEYFNRPEKTNSVLENGWVHTGDIGRIEGEYLYILDRDSNVIVSGGMNVFSIEVEDALGEHPNVSDVAVFGIPDPEWGEAVMAVVSPESGKDVTPQDILNFADNRVASYKKPKDVKIHGELPKTPYGKIDKEALRSQYWNDAERNVN